jgi:1,4-dihydroxy-2-naphthoyl-CoA hydrolase
MPVEGNTQPIGLVHGGAYVVLGESLGSTAANVHAHPNGFAVGIEINATHHKSATKGLLLEPASPSSLEKPSPLTRSKVTDESGDLLVNDSNHESDSPA